MTSMTYRVTGMTCEHCARAVTQELRAVAGVSAVTVALVPGGQSAVTVTSDAPLTAQAVTAALDEAGDYRLSGNDGDDEDGNGGDGNGNGGDGDAAGRTAARGVSAPVTTRALPLA